MLINTIAPEKRAGKQLATIDLNKDKVFESPPQAKHMFSDSGNKGVCKEDSERLTHSCGDVSRYQSKTKTYGLLSPIHSPFTNSLLSCKYSERLTSPRRHKNTCVVKKTCDEISCFKSPLRTNGRMRDKEFQKQLNSGPISSTFHKHPFSEPRAIVGDRYWLFFFLHVYIYIYTFLFVVHDAKSAKKKKHKHNFKKIRFVPERFDCNLNMYESFLIKSPQQRLKTKWTDNNASKCNAIGSSVNNNSPTNNSTQQCDDNLVSPQLIASQQQAHRTYTHLLQAELLGTSEATTAFKIADEENIDPLGFASSRYDHSSIQSLSVVMANMTLDPSFSSGNLTSSHGMGMEMIDVITSPTRDTNNNNNNSNNNNNNNDNNHNNSTNNNNTNNNNSNNNSNDNSATNDNTNLTPNETALHFRFHHPNCPCYNIRSYLPIQNILRRKLTKESRTNTNDGSNSSDDTSVTPTNGPVDTTGNAQDGLHLECCCDQITSNLSESYILIHSSLQKKTKVLLEGCSFSPKQKTWIYNCGFFFNSDVNNENVVDEISYSITPIKVSSQAALLTKPKKTRSIAKSPFKVLDAPQLYDDFYLNLVDWSSQNILAVGLRECVYLWSAFTSKVTKLVDLSGHAICGNVSSHQKKQDEDLVCSVAWNRKVLYFYEKH
ncbi:WD40 repeat-containing protein [Reticulomyxa filosa]|uniref:WD40 repeat-containing protein n=1 Tax=Reticulomyxa filosa TaxID=46433 RepID=X6P002_RETFI|nr:WD40 repeat-containing protein [Reticulomyxa filosa]|eukprot:ETO31394.1 WD40 repeat-containing protein [Reticulomyxa filosa]